MNDRKIPDHEKRLVRERDCLELIVELFRSNKKTTVLELSDKLVAIGVTEEESKRLVRTYHQLSYALVNDVPYFDAGFLAWGESGEDGDTTAVPYDELPDDIKVLVDETMKEL